MAPDAEDKKYRYNAWFPGRRTETTRSTDLKETFGKNAQQNYDSLFMKTEPGQRLTNLSAYRKTNKELGKRMGTAMSHKQFFLESVKEKYGTPEKKPGDGDGDAPKKPDDGKGEFRERLADYLEGVRRDYTRNWITPATGVAKGSNPSGVLDAIRDENTYFKLASDDANEARDALKNDLGVHYVTMRAKGNDSILDKMLGTIGIEKKYETREGAARYSVKSRAEDMQITADNVESFLSDIDRKRMKYVDSDNKTDRFIEGISKKLSSEYGTDWLSLNSRLGSKEKHVSVYDAAKKDAGFAKEAAAGNYEGAITNYLSSKGGSSYFAPAGVPGTRISSFYKMQEGDVELSVPVGNAGYAVDTARKRFKEYRLVK